MFIRKNLKELTFNEIESVKNLSDICSRYDKVCYEISELTDDIDVKDIIFCYLLYEADRFIAYASAYIYSSTAAELKFFIIPEYRGRGYFYQIYNKLLKDIYYEGINNAEFYIQPLSIHKEPAMHILKSLNAQYNGSQCLYELDFNRYKVRVPKELEEGLFFVICKDKHNKNIIKYKINTKNYNISKASVFIQSNSICLFEVYTKKDYRNKGYAGILIDIILKNAAKEKQYKKAVLHVNGENTYAVKLYESRGFICIKRIESYNVKLKSI